MPRGRRDLYYLGRVCAALRTGDHGSRVGPLRVDAAIVLILACSRCGGGAASNDSNESTTEAEPATTTGPTTLSSTSSNGLETSSDSMADDSPLDVSSSSDDSGGEQCLEDVCCDVWKQDCGSNQKCVPWDYAGSGVCCDGTRCVPLDEAPIAIGDACVPDQMWPRPEDDCELGAICLYVGELDSGQCTALCTGDASDAMCAAGTQCILWADDALFYPCAIECDPYGEPCPAGVACAADSLFGPVCDPFPGGVESGYASACTSAFDCAPGYLCLDWGIWNATGATCPGGDYDCCVPWCQELGEPCPDSASGQECVDWPFVAQEYGFCGFP